MSTDALPMDGYIRVSAVAGRSGDRFQSPSAQRDAIEGWAKAHGVKVGIIHEDLDRSGGTMNRPGMNEALRRVEEGLSGGLIVARLDRFARTVIGGLTVITELHEKGARVVSVAEALDPATPMGRAMLGLLLIMAEWQRDQAAEHLVTSQQRAAKAGRYAGRCSYGYRRDATGQQVVDEETADIVRAIFRRRADGEGWRQLERWLTELGVPTPTGRTHWASSSIMGIVESEAPLGTFVGPGGLRVEDAWPAIIDRETWERANEPGHSYPRTQKHDDRLLTGIARCAECSTPLRRRPNTKTFTSYVCPTLGCAARCSVGITILDEYVAGLIDERLAAAHTEPAPVHDDGEEVRLLAARTAAQIEFEAWRDDVGLRDTIGVDDWRAGLYARASARDGATDAYLEHRARRGHPELVSVPGGKVPQLADLTWDVQKRIARRSLHAVYLRPGPVRGTASRRHVGDRVKVFWSDEPNLPPLPVRGSAPGAQQPPPVRW